MITLLEEPKNNPGDDHKQDQLLHFAAISFYMNRSCQLIIFLTQRHTFFVQDHHLFFDKTQLRHSFFQLIFFDSQFCLQMLNHLSCSFCVWGISPYKKVTVFACILNRMVEISLIQSNTKLKKYTQIIPCIDCNRKTSFPGPMSLLSKLLDMKLKDHTYI